MPTSRLQNRLLRAVHAGGDDILLDGQDVSVSYAQLGHYIDDVRVRFSSATAGPVVFAATPGLPARALYMALLAAGITAAPVHASTPLARLRQIVTSLGVAEVIRPPSAGGLTPPERLERATIAADAGSAPPWRQDDRPAYVLHTSGSTGRPKGVPIGGPELCSYLDFVISEFAWPAGSRFSATFSLAFDLALHDLLVPLISGGTSCVAPERMTYLPRYYVSQRGLTQWFSVPGIASIGHRAGSLPQGSLSALRTSLFCGEALARADAAYWAEATGTPVYNLYGPTEMTLAATIHRFADEPYRTVPIGRPFPHLDAKVGSSRHPDELIMRGPQMFGGYVNPDEDAGAFETDADGRRWYRTGDLVEQVDAGLLFHGRIDTQIKLGGHRIDLMDVEHAFRSHPLVQEAIAFVDPEGGGLWLALVAAPGAEPTRTAQLLAHAREQLPGYMVPAEVCYLTELPRNANGKIDRAQVINACQAHLTGNSLT